MQRLLCSDLWTEIKKLASKASRRQAAIAYVTQDLIGLKKGDILIVDASEARMADGATNAILLQKLCNKGIKLFSCHNLHAKVVLMDDYVVIGSGNMSRLSSKVLIEAGFLTDSAAAVAGAASLVTQLAQPDCELKKERIAELCKIEVKRNFGLGRKMQRRPRLPRFGSATWLVGVRELVRESPEKEAKLIDNAYRKLEAEHSDEFEFDWIKWGTKERFARECKQGDTVIQIWRPRSAKRPSAVCKAAPIVLKQRTRDWTRFYLPEPTGKDREISWASFKRLMKEVGYRGKLTPGMVRELDSDVADAIRHIWRG